MRKEESAGAVIYSPKRRKFLLLQHRDGHWEFPKGRLEEGETFEQARVREIAEETGLTHCTVVPFSHETFYGFYRDERVKKRVEYGLFLSDDDVVISDEHQAFVWLGFRETHEWLSFKNHRLLLRAAAKDLVRRGRIIPGFSL